MPNDESNDQHPIGPPLPEQRPYAKWRCPTAPHRTPAASTAAVTPRGRAFRSLPPHHTPTSNGRGGGSQGAPPRPLYHLRSMQRGHLATLATWAGLQLQRQPAARSDSSLSTRHCNPWQLQGHRDPPPHRRGDCLSITESRLSPPGVAPECSDPRTPGVSNALRPSAKLLGLSRLRAADRTVLGGLRHFVLARYPQ